MEADDVVIEYLRGKLKKGRAARAEKVMKPAPSVEAEMPADELPPEELAKLQELVSANGGELEVESEDEEE